MSRSLQFLHSSQEPDGRIPGPPGIIDDSSADSIDNSLYRKWKISYHTTIVASLAALMKHRACNGNGYPAIQRGRIVATNKFLTDLVTKCRQAFYNSARWLCEMVFDQDISKNLRAAAALSMCVRIIDMSPAIQSSLSSLAARIDTPSIEGIPWDLLGADTMLLAYYGMKCAGVTCYLLESETDNIARSVSVDTLAEFPHAFPAVAFLGQLGKVDRRLLMEAILNLPVIHPEVLQGENAIQFSKRLLHSTGGDTTRVKWTLDQRQRVVEWLTSELILSCKDYRLGDVALILRMLLAAGQRGDRVVQDAVTYILSQQKLDGAFGYFANDTNAELPQIHLAWTSGILWALSDFAFPEHSITRLFSVAKN
jgi:hypothetical protein